MTIDYSKIKNLTARELISALLRDGFILRKQRKGGGSSHRIYKHKDGRRVTISFHGTGTTFTFKTLKSMVEEEAGWTKEDLMRLKLVKSV